SARAFRRSGRDPQWPLYAAATTGIQHRDLCGVVGKVLVSGRRSLEGIALGAAREQCGYRQREIEFPVVTSTTLEADIDPGTQFRAISRWFSGGIILARLLIRAPYSHLFPTCPI